jgi:hypothetical protein
MNRPITREYRDPLELVWLHAASLFGMRVVRDSEVFAAWDGRGTLRIGTVDLLDADDSLAQMLLHEMCHALVAGPQQYHREDWGLHYDEPRHRVFEHAALRLQAALADAAGLRRFLAATTEFRKYYDRLAADPLAGDDDAARLAREVFHSRQNRQQLEVLREAIRRTALLRDVVADIAGEGSLWRHSDSCFERHGPGMHAKNEQGTSPGTASSRQNV